MKAVAVVMISSFMFSVWSLQASTGLSVRFMETVTVSTAEYSLADIAEVQAEDPGLKQTVETIKLGVAPRPGYSERVLKKDVVQRIEKLHPEMHGLISWTGSEKISVRSAETWLSLQPFINQARDLLLSDLRQDQDDKTRIEIEPVQPPQGVNVPRGIVDVATRITNNARLNKRMCAWLDIAVNGRHYQTLPVWFSLKAFKPVLSAKRPLSAHQSLRPDDLAAQVQDVAGVPNVLTDFSQLSASTWLKHPLREGVMITTEDLEEMPLVRSGQSVHVTLAMGPVQIETEGVAQIHGRLGDIVRVQNLQTKGIYPARVTGMGMVTVNAR